MRAEVQFRTIAMDFWASLEHKLKYKQDIENADRIALELKRCADTICLVDIRMQDIRKMIDQKQWLAPEADEKEQEKTPWQEGKINEVDSNE